MTEKKQQHKKKRGKVQHIRGSPKKRKISGKAVFSSESIPGKMLADVKNLITDKVSELKRADQKKLFLANFPYLIQLTSKNPCTIIHLYISAVKKIF